MPATELDGSVLTTKLPDVIRNERGTARTRARAIAVFLVHLLVVVFTTIGTGAPAVANRDAGWRHLAANDDLSRRTIPSLEGASGLRLERGSRPQSGADDQPPRESLLLATSALPEIGPAAYVARVTAAAVTTSTHVSTRDPHRARGPPTGA